MVVLSEWLVENWAAQNESKPGYEAKKSEHLSRVYQTYCQPPMEGNCLG